MKKISIWFFLALISVTFNTAALQLVPLQQQSQAAHLSAELLSKYHYKHLPLDDNLSSTIFDNYLKALDGEKSIFLQTDLDQFENTRTRLDDAIIKEDLSIPFAIYNLYQQRITERIVYARSLLKNGFDFKKIESYQYSRKNAPWPKSEAEANDLWRKRVKNDWLRLKLAGQNDKSIVLTLGKRYDNSLNSIAKVKSDDVFQNFMNAYAMAIDPHTNYFGVRASEDFNISMKLSLVGIGAVLQDKDEYTTIRELVAGGPAILSGKLKVGDRIVGVGQGAAGSLIDVMGWRLDDTVALIRGTEDTVVQLDVLPAQAGPDSAHKVISLIRKKISLDKQAAKKSIIEVKEGAAIRHIGVIALPGFYQDFAAHQKGDKNFKSASRDVARILEEFKKDKVDSVLMDLRNNGGGSLSEAIELTGLFIGNGPVVQQRDSKGKITIEKDDHSSIVWNGPLGVLINRASASASEIFAAAIQDYSRGIVIGEQSFGKGTVQTVIDLDQISKNDKPKYGQLKMTIAQFFRINGGTTQLRGVTPDISLPMMTDSENFGESSYTNALPWTKIKSAEYTQTDDLSAIVPALIASHDIRISHDKDFKYLLEDIAELNVQRKKNMISLNEAERSKERKVQEIRSKAREKTTSHENFQDDGMQSNERKLDADLALEKARTNARDVLLDEAAHILSDELGLLKPKLAKNN
jgi:carboxyl-terminal processing protease